MAAVPSFRAATFRIRPYDLDGAAAAAQAAAIAHADGLAPNYDASGAAASAQAAAQAHADAAAASAQAAAIAHADGLASNYDASGAAAAAQAAAQSYADTKVADLVASAPATLDTLHEIAAALGNDANLAATLTTAIGAKADQTTVDSLDARVGAAEGGLSSLEGRIAAEEAKTQAQDQALNVLVGSDGALDVETAPGSGVTFVYTGSFQS